MNTKPQISERVYQEVVSRIEHGKVPIYPSLVRRRAIERYKAEKIAEIERAKRETERKIREEQRRREERRRKEERRHYEEMKKALEATKKRIHVGHWVKVEKGGKVTACAGMAAMSPSQAKSLGYKWGTMKWNPKTGEFEFVPLPGEPTEPEYYGILKWKYESGHYKHPEVAKRIKEEIEIGAKKYGIVAPAWAGGYLKEYREIANQIRESYLKATQSETKLSTIELKKALDSQSKVMQDLQRLQVQRAMLEKQIKATTHLAEEAKAKYREYEKGEWTPEEIVKYGLLAGAVGGISKTLETQISEYNKQVQQLRESMRREQQRPVQPSVRVSIPKQTVVKPPIATKKPEIPVVYSPLMQEIKATGKVPTIHIPEQTKAPMAFEALIEPIKRITGYYPEKEEVLRTTMSMYRKHQLDLAESLGVIHKEKDTGKRYIIVNNTKYIEGTKGFDEHLGEAIQSKLNIKEPPEVKRRQKAIRSANRALSEFLESYGGKPGEPIILTTPESKKAFEKVKATFEGIPEETTTTKAYWEEVGKIQKAQPQLQELNVLAEQATKQAKEMEKIRKESWFGIPYKIESLGEKYSPYVKKAIPPVRPYAEVKTPEDLVRAVEKTYEWRGAELTEQQRKAIEESYIRGKKAYGIYRRMFGLPPEPFKWEKKATQLEAGIKAGQIEEIRAHPIKGAITVASFATLPPIFKGAGAIWKGAGLATKLPRITKYAPKIILGGMGAGYAGGVGYETYKAPTLEKKGEVLGRTSVEIAEMAAGTYMGIKTSPSYIKGIEISPEGAIRSYKGLGIGETRRPIIGIFKETLKTPEVSTAQRALVLGEDYPALRYLRSTETIQFKTPWMGRGAGGWRTITTKEIGIGRAIKFETKKGEALWGRDVFLGEIKKPPITPEYKALPETTTRAITLWKRGKDVSLAKRPTEIEVYEPPDIKEIVPRGIRIEARKIPTYTELIPGRLYKAEVGYKAFQIGKYPKHIKILNMAKPKYRWGGINWANLRRGALGMHFEFTQKGIAGFVSKAKKFPYRQFKELEEPSNIEAGPFRFLGIEERKPVRRTQGYRRKDLELYERFARGAYRGVSREQMKMYERFARGGLNRGVTKEQMRMYERFARGGRRGISRDQMRMYRRFIRKMRRGVSKDEMKIYEQFIRKRRIGVSKEELKMYQKFLRARGIKHIIFTGEEPESSVKLISITGGISKKKGVKPVKKGKEIISYGEKWKKEEEELLKGEGIKSRYSTGQIILQKTEQRTKSKTKEKPKQEEIKLTAKGIEEEIAKITGITSKKVRKVKQPRTIYEEFKESIITKPRTETVWKPKIRRKVRMPTLVFYLPSTETKEPKAFKEAKDYIKALEKKRTKYTPYEWQKFVPLSYEGYKFEPISLERFRSKQISIPSPITATPPAMPSIQIPEIRFPEIQQPKEMLKTATPEIKPPEILEISYFPFPYFPFPHEKKKRPRHRKYRRSPYEWFEYHPIPTLKEMFGVVGLPQQKSKTKTKHSTEITSVINQIIGKTPKL